MLVERDSMREGSWSCHLVDFLLCLTQKTNFLADIVPENKEKKTLFKV